MAIHTNAVADVKADLYATIPGDGSIVTLTGNNTRGDIIPVDYLYDANSSAPDNYPSVIQPTLQTGNGRWIKTLFNQYQADWNQSNSSAPDFINNKPTIGTAKRQETYSGTTSGSGTYTITFATAFASTPNIQAVIITGTDTQSVRITAISSTGFTVLVRNRTDTLGLLPAYGNVNGATVNVIVTEI